MEYFLFSFCLNQKETKNQVKNMLHAPHGILRILRSAKSLNSCLTIIYYCCLFVMLITLSLIHRNSASIFDNLTLLFYWTAS